MDITYAYRTIQYHWNYTVKRYRRLGDKRPKGLHKGYQETRKGTK